MNHLRVGRDTGLKLFCVIGATERIINSAIVELITFKVSFLVWWRFRSKMWHEGPYNHHTGLSKAM